MSQTTNNRQKVFEDKSTRGPRRKLKLIIEDGKRYIKKRIFYITSFKLDGNLHEKEADMDRDYVLKSLGYKVIRLDLKTLGITRFSKEKEVRKCIKKLVLPKLNS